MQVHGRLVSSAFAAAALSGAVGLLAACSSSSTGSLTSPAGSCTYPYGVPSPATDTLAAERQACTFAKGALTSQTIGGPVQSMSRLEHVIVVMLENRSFDHYFSDLPSAMGADVAGADTNPDGHGGVVTRYHEPGYCEITGSEPQHEWGDAHLAYSAGKMDGFVAATGAPTPMGYYNHCDLPLYYQLAQKFAISDRHFSPLLGPTWPNRLFFFAGTSCGYAEGADTNALVTLECGLVTTSLLDELDDAHVKHRVYDESGLLSVIVGEGVSGPPGSLSDFFSDVAAMPTNLPAFSIVGASTGSVLTPPEDDDHPTSDVRGGQTFVYDVIQALVANPAVWASTALFITYDENGGYYDHVAPPAACDPGGPRSAASKRDYLFDQYGFRVPLMVVSPFAVAGHVSHFDTDHTSITRFVEHWQNLPALTYRDANAWPLLDLFDFNQAPITLTMGELTMPQSTGGVPCAATPATCP